ncbi:sulfate adenylyltransferase [Ferrovibrio sp.]|uniref:sulfate adenylyltransferase n=1 Tax=Ferrovibrio sp. TaxID=1917215 RepID=UPI00311D63B0
MTADPVLTLTRDQYLELEKIGLGAFAPLTGFMTEAEFLSVVATMRLPGGAVFSLPVVLDVDAETAAWLQALPVVDLQYGGERVGRLTPRDYFRCDRPAVARQVFGTDDPAHPGVSYFFGLQAVFVGGAVEFTGRSARREIPDELTPRETRDLFQARGWTTVAGFQTRNVPHRAHEYLQRVALEHVDGLFIQPLVGRKRAGDYTPDAVMTGYRALVGQFLPADRVVLGSLSTLMRYAGPREAVFHAIIRRNYGCTHFIVGRDHAGVGSWYGLYDAHELTRRFDGDLGIEILRLHGPYFCPVCDGMVTDKTCPHAGGPEVREVSGTDMRRILSGGEKPDPRLMRPEIVAALAGTALFIED